MILFARRFLLGVERYDRTDPDLRVQNAVHSVFRKFREPGSARQVLVGFRAEQLARSAIGYEEKDHKIYWKLPLYHSILAILTDPVYAGAYAFGRSEVRTKVMAGRARRTQGHRKPRDQGTALIRDHHAGYITWEQFELNQKVLAENAHMKSRMGRQSGRGGRSLLVGLLRCHRCARMLRVHYFGKPRKELRYQCINGHINQGVPRCISFGGVRVYQAVSEEILKVVQPLAIEAALQAAEQQSQQQAERTRPLELELGLEQARYEARVAGRRYEAVDPDNRLVSSELEARWNTTLCRVRELEGKLDLARWDSSAPPIVDKGP